MKHGQAALEFLITYGWALAALIVAIGAVTYFTGGYKVFMPSICDLDTPFSCTEYRVTSDGAVIMGISNNAHQDMIATNLTILCNQDAAQQQTYVSGLLKEGERLNKTYVRFSCPLGTGNRFRATLGLSYTMAGTNVPHMSEGTLRAKVE